VIRVYDEAGNVLETHKIVGKNTMKKLAVIILTCFTTSLYADLGDDYNTCLKQLEKTGKPVHHDDANGYPMLQAQGDGIQRVTLFFNKAKTHCIVEEITSPDPVQVNLMKVTLARYHKHWKIDNVDDSNVWAESTDGRFACRSHRGPGVFGLLTEKRDSRPSL
jgi:hypothetical protein